MAPRTNQHSINLLYAGSMTNVVENTLTSHIKKLLGIQLEGESAGSSELAGFIQSGQKRADLFISASPSVIEKSLFGAANHNRARWYLTFAGDSLVIAYNPKSHFAPQLAEAAEGRRTWVSILSENGFRLGRTDPVLDPKGLATLAMGRLAAAYYHMPSLSSQVFGAVENPSQVFPEEDLLGRLNAGQMDAVIAYRHEAVEWKLPYISLPPQINLGDAKYAKHYKSVKIKVGQQEKTGGLIEFALTVPNNAANPKDGTRVASYLLGHAGQSILRMAGFASVSILVGGDKSQVPKALKPFIEGDFK